MSEKDVLTGLEISVKRNRYIKLSLIFLLLTVLLLAYVIASVPQKIKVGDPILPVPYTVIICVWLFCFSGTATSVISLIRREQPASLKILVFILNTLLLLALLSLVLFVKLMDANRA